MNTRSLYILDFFRAKTTLGTDVEEKFVDSGLKVFGWVLARLHDDGGTYDFLSLYLWALDDIAKLLFGPHSIETWLRETVYKHD